jgi:head-tail adaptor
MVSHARTLDQRITIQAQTGAADALGQTNIAWLTDSTVWARVLETPGREFLKGEFHDEARVVFTLRWRHVASASRVLWNGRTWRVVSITGTRRERFISLDATDGAN